MGGQVRVSLKVVAGLIFVCFLGTAFGLLAMRTFFGTVLNEPASIQVDITAPAQVPRDEPFAVTLEVTSLITTSQTLHSVDLETGFLENVPLSASTPAYKTVRSLPLTSFTSYRYEVELPAEERVAIELIFVGRTSGNFAGLIDVCLADGTLCLANPIQTTIIE